MPYRITDACTACDMCIDVCPVGAILEGDPMYIINDSCCDFEECLVECEVDAIVLKEEGSEEVKSPWLNG